MNMPVQPTQPRPQQPGQTAPAQPPAAMQQPQAPQPGGGAPQAPGAAPASARNPVRDLLLKRLDTLSPDEGNALMDGISPEAAQVLKKILPEVADTIDEMISAGAMMAQNGGGQPMPEAESEPAPGAQPPMARSRLATI